MSCPPEWSLGAYVDSELLPDELRSAESHLVGCERCRRLVLALQAEARQISEVLGDRAPSVAPSTRATSSAQGLATGFPVALGVLASVVAVLGFLVESRLPSGLDWIRPRRFFGAQEMILDLLFTIRDRAPGMLELGLAIAVTASVAALITFVTTALLRRIEDPRALGSGLLLALAVGLGGPEAARAAADVRLDQSVHVGPDEVLEQSLVTSGESLVVEGRIAGNLVAFCERVAIRGVVEGDVWVLTREFELGGRVEGTVHAFGGSSRISGTVERGLYAGSDRLTIEPDAVVSRDAVVVSDRFVHEGTIGRDLTGGIARGEIQGRIGRHAEFWSEQITVMAGSVVGGDLVAHVDEEEDARIDEGAEVAGTLQVLPGDPALQMRSHYEQPAFYLWRLVWLAAAFGVGLLLHTLVPSLFEAGVASGAEFFRALGLGFAFGILAPMVLAVVALTVVGIPLALIGAGLFAMAWYVSVLLLATLIGRAVTSPRTDSLRDVGLALLVGLVLVTIAFHLPWIGFLFRIVGMLLGAGLLLDRALVFWRERQVAAY